jgi:hypothetical protein
MVQVQRSRKALLDALPINHRADLDDPVSDHCRQLGFVFVRAFQGKIPWLVAIPFAINLVANVLFMPIFAGLRNVPLACADILIVWATIIWCVFAVWSVYRWVCKATGIPLVYDVHHHRCNPDGLSVEQATRKALATWDREPLFHISSPIEGWDGPTPERHHDFINVTDFPHCWQRKKITVEVEARAKEVAVEKLLSELAGNR